MATMTNTVGQFVKYEAPNSYSREDVTVLSGQNLAAGTVVGRVTASGKIAAYTPGASDGTQNAMGVLVTGVNASAADATGVIIARHAITVDKTGLVWGAAVTTDTHKNTGVAALKALGILCRATV